MKVKFCSSFLKTSRPSSSHLPFLHPLGEQGISRLDGDINPPQFASGAPSGAHAQSSSPGRREGAILTKCPNLLHRLLLTGRWKSEWEWFRYLYSSTWVLPPRGKLISAACAGHLILLATTHVGSEAALFYLSVSCSILPSLGFLLVAREMQSWSWCS